MKGKDELRLAYGLAFVLLLIGVLGYAALPPRVPDQPVRMVFKNKAGQVLFDHKEHSSPLGYGYRCEDCHHDIEEEGERPSSCGECHMPEDGNGLGRSDAFHNLCQGCHDQSGLGPVDCSGCHVL
ncbi:MAG: cytochrome c3 family protein [Deltaproteobacteria bacterium]|nr:cytochrome c3 family protein [Deltaproteobacteria bacterium]